jgi:hypothetical protein
MNDTTPLQPSDATAETTRSTPLAATGAAAPLKPRVGTILWGFILLIVGTIAVLASRLDLGDFGPEVFVWSIVGLGAILVVAAIIAAVARAARNRAAE